MKETIEFAALGIGGGTVYALLGQGIVLVHRGSGVLNFAHGAFAMFSTFVFFKLSSASAWPIVPAIIAGIAVGAALGVLTHVAIMRPLRVASPLTRVIATLALLVTIQALAQRLWGTTQQYVPPFLTTSSVEIGGVSVPTDRLVLLGIAAAITASLWALFRFTRFGMATRAAAQNPTGAAALGWSPDGLAAVNWALGGALGAVAGILSAPQIGLDATTLTLTVIAALAAVLIGGFRSFPLTLLGGLLLGIGQSEIANYVTQPGVAEALPLVVILVVLVARGSTFPARAYVADRFSALGGGRVRAAVVVPTTAAGVVLMLFVFSDDVNNAVSSSLAYAVILLSIVVVTGYAGQLSLAQLTFAGLGALVAGKLVDGVGLPFELAIVVAVLAMVPVGLVLGLPAVRARGVSLAAVTLSVAMAVQAIVFANPSLTGDTRGTVVGPQTFFSIDVGAVRHPGNYAVLVLMLFVLCATVVGCLRRGRVGRRLVAVRANERAAAALGISVVGTKLYAFAIGAAIAALGGILIGFQGERIVFDGFDPVQSVFAVAFAVIGGIGYLIGPLFGMLFLVGGLGTYVAGKLLSGIDEWIALIGGVSLLVCLLVAPDGLARAHTDAARRLAERLRPAPRDRAEPAQVAGDATARKKVRPAALTVEDLTVRYGAVVAVQDVSLTVEPGQVVALIGPNGAGKTSVIDAVTGFARSTGSMTLGAARIDRWPPHRRARAGISRSFQSLELFEDVTVGDNLRVASDPRDRRAYVTDLVAPGDYPLTPTAWEAVREFGLGQHLDARPSDLSYSERRLAAVARAVATEPSVLLLDEPASGLSDHESLELADLVRRLADDWGIAVLVVEHDMDFVMRICDRITVLDFGRVIAEGTPDEVRADEHVVAAYLGEPLEVDSQEAM